jgi:hypothetical protein
LCHLHHEPPHILCWTEHRLYYEELVSLHIDIYTLGSYYCRKTKHKGSVCMFIHNSITLTVLNIDSYCLDQNTAVCTIYLNSLCDKLYILAIYRSPLCNLTTFLTNFDLILHKFFNLKFNIFYVETLILITLQREWIKKKFNLTVLHSLLISVALSIFLLE